MLTGVAETDLVPRWLPPELRGVTEQVPFPLVLDPAKTTNVHVAFRGEFQLNKSAVTQIRFLGAHWFRCWIDGEFLADGPARFHPSFPEFELREIELASGVHIFSAHVHHEGVTTRLLKGEEIPPFFSATIQTDGQTVPISWRCRRLDAYRQIAPRRSSLLGWSEQCDTRELPREWVYRGYEEDCEWCSPVEVPYDVSEARAVAIPAPSYQVLKQEVPAFAALDGCFSGYGTDVALGFLRRDLHATAEACSGRWWRFDLGRVMLGYLRVRFRAAPGAIIETGAAESLLHGRVFPWCYYSEGPTCFVNRYLATGDEQVVEWHSPMGARFVEVHCQAIDGIQPELNSVEFVERSFLPPSIANEFRCGDDEIQQVWGACVATMRSCAEDTLVDPVRERGQWTGDNMTVGIEVLAATTGELSIIERNARQIAQCAREDGLAAGLCPGTPGYFTSYATYWQSAIWRLLELGGDESLAVDLLPALHRNLRCFDQAFTSKGLCESLGDTFIDWGYTPSTDLPDLATLALLRRATKATIELDRRLESEHLNKSLRLMERIDTFLGEFVSLSPQSLGYHTTALFLAEQLFSSNDKSQAIEYLKSHIRDCFPMNLDAPRLLSPAERGDRFITPYFMHFVLPALIEEGETAFAVDVIRRCWGWSLKQGLTTIPEVFSEAWSHCHPWSCAPAWLLPRYGLGLCPSGVAATFDFRIPLLEIGSASGSVPIPGTRRRVRVEWTIEGDEVNYRIKTPVPLYLRDVSSVMPEPRTMVTTESEWRFPLPKCRPRVSSI